MKAQDYKNTMWVKLTNEQRPAPYTPVLLKSSSAFGTIVRIVMFNDYNVAVILWEDTTYTRPRITARQEVCSYVLLSCTTLNLDKTNLDTYLNQGIKWEWQTIRPLD